MMHGWVKICQYLHSILLEDKRLHLSAEHTYYVQYFTDFFVTKRKPLKTSFFLIMPAFLYHFFPLPLLDPNAGNKEKRKGIEQLRNFQKKRGKCT